VGLLQADYCKTFFFRNFHFFFCFFWIFSCFNHIQVKPSFSETLRTRLKPHLKKTFFKPIYSGKVLALEFLQFLNYGRHRTSFLFYKFLNRRKIFFNILRWNGRAFRIKNFNLIKKSSEFRNIVRERTVYLFQGNYKER
jgi:hypothetical protein